MDNSHPAGGYGNSSGAGDANNAFGSDFISFGPETPSETSKNQWGRGRWRGRPHPHMQRISGTMRGHNRYMENDRPFQHQPQHNRPSRGSYQHGSNQPFHHNRGGPHGGDGFGFRGNRYQRGPRHQVCA